MAPWLWRPSARWLARGDAQPGATAARFRLQALASLRLCALSLVYPQHPPPDSLFLFTDRPVAAAPTS
ncbi:MAG TPA: hypothetical protein VMV29_00975 [Ktedonobacterales bacterium]|nr:hypothetical protein [Ktedonobacterales bacterium]